MILLLLLLLHASLRPQLVRLKVSFACLIGVLFFIFPSLVQARPNEWCGRCGKKRDSCHMVRDRRQLSELHSSSALAGMAGALGVLGTCCCVRAGPVLRLVVGAPAVGPQSGRRGAPWGCLAGLARRLW